MLVIPTFWRLLYYVGSSSWSYLGPPGAVFISDLDPKGPKYPNRGYLGYSYLESQVWLWEDTLYLDTWTLRMRNVHCTMYLKSLNQNAKGRWGQPWVFIAWNS